MGYKDIYKESQKAGALKELVPTFKRFEKVGDTIIGRLKAISSVKSSLAEGEYNQYLFDTDEGLVKFQLGGATDREIASVLEINEVYYIEFTGEQKIKGGAKRKVYKVKLCTPPAEQVGVEQDLPFEEEKGGE